ARQLPLRGHYSMPSAAGVMLATRMPPTSITKWTPVFLWRWSSCCCAVSIWRGVAWWGTSSRTVSPGRAIAATLSSLSRTLPTQLLLGRVAVCVVAGAWIDEAAGQIGDLEDARLQEVGDIAVGVDLLQVVAAGDAQAERQVIRREFFAEREAAVEGDVEGVIPFEGDRPGELDADLGDVFAVDLGE